MRRPDPLVDQLTEVVDWPERRMRLRYDGWPVPQSRLPLQRMRRIWQAIVDEARCLGLAAATWAQGRGPLQVPTVMFTALPGGCCVPPDGLWETTSPGDAQLRTVDT
jgi:hypothetical protein